MTPPRFLCSRCPYTTDTLSSYTDHLTQHYPHLHPPAPPPPQPEWRPILSREIL